MARVVAKVIGGTNEIAATITVAAAPTPSLTPPVGYTLIKGQTLSNPQIRSGSKKAYQDCVFPSGVNVQDAARDIWFGNCDMAGFWCYGGVDNVQVVGGKIGGRAQDGAQVWGSMVSGAWRVPTNIIFNGVLFHDVTKADPADHPDGLQVGGVKGLKILNCEFRRIDVQPIFINGWAGACDDILIDNCKVWKPVPTGFHGIIVGSGEPGFRTTNALVSNCRSGSDVLIAQDNGATSAASRNVRKVNCVEFDPALQTP